MQGMAATLRGQASATTEVLDSARRRVTMAGMADETSVAAAIEAALRVVDGADVPEDLRAVAFEKAYESLAGAGPAPQQQQAASLVGLGDRPTARDESETAQVAVKLRIEQDLVERVLDFDEDGVHLMVPRSLLARQKSAAIHQVATLVVAGRQGAGREEWTPLSAVRRETETLGVEDRSNFAMHMKQLDGVRMRGSGRTGELKMNAVGFENAAELVRQFARLGSGGNS